MSGLIKGGLFFSDLYGMPDFAKNKKKNDRSKRQLRRENTVRLLLSLAEDGLRPYPFFIFLFSVFFRPRRATAQPSGEENAVFIEIRHPGGLTGQNHAFSKGAFL